MEIVSEELELSAKVQKGLKLIQESRFHKKPSWGQGLTVLDKRTVKLPIVKRKALAIKKVLAEMPIQIRNHELLVGSVLQGSIQAWVPFPEYATQEEKQAAAKNLTGTGSIFGHFEPSYTWSLRMWLCDLRKMAEEKLDEVRKRGIDVEKEAWYESVIISLDGVEELIRRHKDLALELADSETDVTRGSELYKIAGILQRLLQRPPQSFHEALQAFWFIDIAINSTMNFSSLGRFDQNLWPYLKRDLENDAITINEAQELIDLLWLKFNERLQPFEVVKGTSYMTAYTGEGLSPTLIGLWSLCLGGKTSQDRFAIYGANYNQFYQTMALSGLTPDGLDGTNLLTYLCLNATRRLGLPQPELYVRLHDGSPPDLYEVVADCIRAGLINPSIYNDEAVIPAFEKWGFPVEDARDYTSDGCWEAHPQGKTYFKYGFVSAIEALDRVISPASWEELEVPVYIEDLDPYKGRKAPDPYRFRSFDEIEELVKENLDIYIKRFLEVALMMRDDRLYRIAPLPLKSAFVEGPLESGKDITQGGMKYAQHSLVMAGLSHTADSMAVIKKLCFEEKVIEWSELLDAIRNNWQGEENLRQLVRTRAPAYGNDVDYVDDIARDIVEFFINSVRKQTAEVRTEVKFLPGIATFDLYLSLGRVIGATPDGRLAGEPIGSNASPSNGRAVSGQTATLNSFFKLPNVDLPTGAALDLTMPSDQGLLLHLETLIKSFVQRRGSLLTISVNDCSTLRAAQREPEKYRDLKVRMGGWEAYFIDLPPQYQQWQIEKCQ